MSWLSVNEEILMLKKIAKLEWVHCVKGRPGSRVVY